MIREARNERKLTAQELADRAGISRGMLQRIEKGNLKCEIGAVFEVATIVGIKLFDADGSALAKQLRHTKEKLALMPKSIRRVGLVRKPWLKKAVKNTWPSFHPAQICTAS